MSIFNEQLLYFVELLAQFSFKANRKCPVNQGFNKANLSFLLAKGILTDALPSKRWFPVNAGKKSGALFLYQSI